MENMAQSARVEITEKGLRILKIETAISGLSQKAALESLILRGASSDVVELVEGKPQMEEEEMEEMEDKPGNARPLIELILSELREGREPTVADIAERTGLSTQMISKTLTRYEIRAKETKRGGKPGRYFIKSMKGDIESVFSKL